jgi:FkbM family methyltransferase
MLGLPLAKHREHIQRFGRQFWLRNLWRRTRDGLKPIYLSGLPPIYVRPGESDLEVIHEVYFEASYEIPSDEASNRVRSRYSEILESGRVPIIVDAGANIGISTTWFARAFPRAQIVAIEPDPDNFTLLCTNLAQYPACVPVEAALGSARGFAKLSRPGDQRAWATQTKRSKNGVPIITVDDALAQSGGDEPFIVKMDIEGFERDVFASGLGWLDQTCALLVEPHDWMFPGERVSSGMQRAMSERPFDLIVNGRTLAYVRV